MAVFNKKNQAGFNIAEILIVIGLTVFLVTMVSKSFVGVRRIQEYSKTKFENSHYAQEGMELINEMKNSLFACKCSSDTCLGDTCTRSADSQSCTLLPGYDSCWTRYPAGLSGLTDFKLYNSGNWTIVSLGGSPEEITSDQTYYRKVKIESAMRNSLGDLDPSGTNIDDNTKLINVQVYTTQNERIYTTSYDTVLTAWENL
ncbi:hypothetical protein C0583_06975 [Candidatus Parcubacteria bacterium]|nr:MAG: hypothetical protein C0583_06975 [Candidatus Parcubacteria bacterium]